MNVMYSIGYAYGVALFWAIPAAAVVLAVPRSRRRVLGPLTRRLAARRAHDGATLAYTRQMPPNYHREQAGYPVLPDEPRLDSAPGAGDATAAPGT